MTPGRSLSPNALSVSDSKSTFWEYKLTGIVLREWVGPIEQRYRDLSSGLYARPRKFIAKDDFLGWISPQMEILSDQTQVLNRLINSELSRSWSASKEAGSVEDIARICSYIADACAELLEWEENVRLVITDDVFLEILKLLPDVAGPYLFEVMRIPQVLEEITCSQIKRGEQFAVTLSLPEGWEEQIWAAMRRLKDRLGIYE